MKTMNIDILVTPPPRKPAPHHGMADRKLRKHEPVRMLEGCTRRLFAEESLGHIGYQTKHMISSLRC
jgi:hypothetical protein